MGFNNTVQSLNRKRRPRLDERFRFAEDSFRAGPAPWTSRLRPATGIEDGERYLVRLFPKTGTVADDDLKNLLASGLRRIRRVLSSRRARDVLVEILEVVEDDDEVGIVMLDPGPPLSGAPHGAIARRQRCLTNAGRKLFWQNIQRVLEGLTLCHDVGIVHGSIGEHAIFTDDDGALSYRLGGYESCVQIADGDPSTQGELLRASGPISFRSDLADLSKVVAKVLGVDAEGGAVLTGTERQALNRLADPPKFQMYDGHVAQKDLKAVVDELGRIGSNADGELVLYPARHTLQSDLPSLTSGAVAADDVEAVIRSASNDLLGPAVRAGSDRRGKMRIITDLAIYHVLSLS